MNINRPAIRYHGGKFRLASWIVEFFPAHTTYVEPFGGAAGVLIQKPVSYAEIYNDLDGDIVNYFRVLRDPDLRIQLERAVALTPYARDEFDIAWTHAEDPVERARRTAIRAQMGFGSAGATKGSTGFRIDCKRKYGTAQHLWAEFPRTVAAVGQRFESVLVENRPALDVVRQFDAEDTLFYVDPPYVHETRVMRTCRGGTGAYRHEMNDQDHQQLIDVLISARGMVVLSGYPHPLYEEALCNWATHTKRARISAGRGTSMRTECVWINPACQSALESKTGGLFA